MMVGMTQQKVLAWGGAITGALLAGGLLVLAVARDLDKADQLASVVGAAIGLASLGVSVYALRQPASLPGSGSTVTVTASGDSAVAAGRDISGEVSTGNRHFSGRERRPRRTQDVPPPAVTGNTVQATGDGAVAAGRDITGNVSTSSEAHESGR
jgi:hypothetical protein